jgi:hypothetical protein
MKLSTISLALVAAVAVTSGALAASTVGDPLALALKQSDLPAGAQLSVRRDPASGLRALGRGLRGANYSGTFAAGGGTVATPLGDLDKEWYIEGDVIVAPSRSAARSVFQLGKRAQIGFFSDFPGTPRYVRLPAYGDQQMAFVSRQSAAGGVSGAVFVRKGRVVWQVRVAPIPRQYRPTQAQVLAQLRTYAAKQKRRVGAG